MTEPGWYTDPRDNTQYRYWDGAAWTEAVAPATATTAAASDPDPAPEAGGAVDAEPEVEPVPDPAPPGDGASLTVDEALGDLDAQFEANEPLAAAESGLDAAIDSGTEQAAALSDRIGGFDDATKVLPDDLADVVGDPIGDARGSALGAATGALTDRVGEELGGVSDAVADAGSPGGLIDDADGLAGRVDDAAGSLGSVAGQGLDALGDTAAETAGSLGSVAGQGFDALGDTAAETAGSLGSVAGQGFDALGDATAETAGSLGSVAGQGFDALGDATAETADPLGSAADAATIAFERDGVPGSTALSRPVEQPGGASAVPVDRAPAEDGQTGPSLAAETAFISPPSGPPGVDGLAPPPPTGVGLGEVPTVPPPDSYPAPSVPAPAGPGVGGLPSAPGSGFGEPPPAPPQDFLGGAGAAAPPPALTPERSRLPWIILGIVALAAFALILFLVLRPSDQTSVASITQGQCFADFGQFQGDEVRTSVSSADCTEPHALEVFDVTSSPYAGFDDYPGNQIIEDLAFEHCLSGFEPFVGIAYGESVLDVWALYPTEGSWTITGDREVVCMVGQADESLTTGTLEGSGR